jgi:hypothetical protein
MMMMTGAVTLYGLPEHEDKGTKSFKHQSLFQVNAT